LTDGFIEGGQLPTLNLANEFLDFDDSWVESCIGWHGGTALLRYQGSVVDLSFEGTFLTYNTNAQFRDVDSVYPTFLHSDGYTDTDVFDYANVLDRGRDPRSVFRRHQERMTGIGVLKLVVHTGWGRGLSVGAKAKLIYDQDTRQEHVDSDDYYGWIAQGRLWLDYPVFDGVTVRLGSQFDYWDEENRRGSPELGYGDDQTTKVKPFLDLSAAYEGLEFRYYLEYVYKDALRERAASQTFHIIRSKATLKVSW
jgi:hypothetical protein